MKKLIGAMLLALVVAAATPAFLENDNGRLRIRPPDMPRVSLALPKLAQRSSSQNSIVGVESQPVRTDRVRIYQWRDSRGQWHFSGEPPPDGSAAQAVDVDLTGNTLSAPDDSQSDASGSEPAVPTLPSSPYDVRAALEAAKEARRAMEARLEQQRELLN